MRVPLLAVCGAVAVTAVAALVIRLNASPAESETALVEPSTRVMASAMVGAPAASASPPPRGSVLRYTFDDGIAPLVHDTEQRLPLRFKGAAGGVLTATRHGSGLAVRFPEPCAQYGAKGCQRAILQSGDADFLNPGVAPFRYGASVLLAPSETSKGANVVQKGFSVGDAQFKLQVDGHEGNPTCVLVGAASPTIYVAQSSVSVANGQWHQIECSRGNALLTISVDGITRGQTAIPPSLSIVNSDPLCIGGKGTSPNNDQFTGVIDDVFIARNS